MLLSQPLDRRQSERCSEKKKKKSYLTAKALCLQLPPPFPRCFRYNTVSFLCLTTAYCVAHREYHFNCVVLSNRLFVAIEKRFCSRPVILRHAISIHFLLSSYSFLLFFFYIEKRLHFVTNLSTNREISRIFSFLFFFVPSLKNSENLEIKLYKKKIAFSLLLSTMLKREEDVWVKQGEASCWKILIIHRLASIMKPSWSDGRRNTNCPLCPPTFKTCSRRRRRACWFPFHSASCSRARDR